jgi:hypothetical protein
MAAAFIVIRIRDDTIVGIKIIMPVMINAFFMFFSFQSTKSRGLLLFIKILIYSLVLNYELYMLTAMPGNKKTPMETQR